MKILLVAINAKYIHSNLAVYSLKAYAKNRWENESLAGINPEVKIVSFTINQYIEDIREQIYKEHPDVLAFSCYIWNIAMVEDLLRDLEKLLPGVPVWLGGPEVSWAAEQYLEKLPMVTGIMCGEGEETFADLCDFYRENLKDKDQGEFARIQSASLKQIPGIYVRGFGSTGLRAPLDMAELPFVYGDLEEFSNRIIYYETSRGCPFSCSYCLSSIERSLRFRPIEMVKRELAFFLEKKVSQVKFVDRTFNCKHSHAMEIWMYIQEHDNGVTNFHFEIAADLLRDEEIELLSKMRPGLVQLEIGVQSTNITTLKEIRRATDIDIIRQKTAKIKQAGNIHQHLDLIAGLPYEDFASFRNSFNEVYGMKPDQLQLGFLKVLHGSFMEEKASEYGAVYSSKPMYEVFYTKWLTYDDVLRLKRVEEMVETFYNSGQFHYTLEVLVDYFESPFDFYEQFAYFYDTHVAREQKITRLARYELLYQFIMELKPEAAKRMGDYLLFDFYVKEHAKNRPSFATDLRLLKDELKGFYRQFPQGADVHIERFGCEEKTCYLVFDYRERNPLTKDAKVSVL